MGALWRPDLDLAEGKRLSRSWHEQRENDNPPVNRLLTHQVVCTIPLERPAGYSRHAHSVVLQPTSGCQIVANVYRITCGARITAVLPSTHTETSNDDRVFLQRNTPPVHMLYSGVCTRCPTPPSVGVPIYGSLMSTAPASRTLRSGAAVRPRSATRPGPVVCEVRLPVLARGAQHAHGAVLARVASIAGTGHNAGTRRRR